MCDLDEEILVLFFQVAIIIPFRYRHQHLIQWLYYLHPILQRQQLDYGVYVINQEGEGTFNKARLMNAGFIKAMNEYNYTCVVFSDVDLIPLDDRNLYHCFSKPRHLAVAVDKFDFTLPYPEIFGGVISLSKEDFLTINGFSNSYWGWGGEDDDIYQRVAIKIKEISRPDMQTGRYKMIKHERDVHNELNNQRGNILQRTSLTMEKDGINSLTYNVTKVEKDRLYTFITVDVGSPD